MAAVWRCRCAFTLAFTLASAAGCTAGGRLRNALGTGLVSGTALGLGVVHRSLRSVRDAVGQTLARLPELHAAVARIDNRAVFEVPEILARLLACTAATTAAEREDIASPV